jgi:hypothetical protein
LPASRHCLTRATLKVCSPGFCCLFDCFANFSLLLAAFDAESRFLSAEDQNRELTRSIRREVAKLTEQWNHLINRSDGWKHRLDEYMTVSLVINLTSTSLKVSAHNRHKIFTFNRAKRARNNFFRLPKLSRRHLE